MSISQLTDRELDVVACLLNGRTVKKTALLLNIYPRTVETYLRNLMIKLQCNSRDHLIDFITKTNQLNIIREHYAKIIGEEFNSLPADPILKYHSIRIAKIIFYLAVPAMLLSFISVICYYWMNNSNAYIKDELELPPSSFFLERSKLLEEIDRKFDSHKNIQTVILVGKGGAGKTTLAYHYANQYNKGIVWSIHANTKENILLSFEKLILEIMHKEKSHEELNSLQAVQNKPQYEKRLLIYLKEKLKKNPNWLLIFDNVQSFKEIRDYLPNEGRNWGNGRIIIMK